MHSFYLLFSLITFLPPTLSFYTYLPHSQPQCFYTTIFKQQRLLIELQTPIISLAHKIKLTVKNDNETLLQKDVVNQVQFNVPRQSNVITGKDGGSLEYETCLEVVREEDSEEGEGVERKGYLVSIKMYTNFQHKLQNHKERAQSKQTVDYSQLTKMSKKLTQLNKAQIDLHQVNEVKQKLSQYYLQALKGRVIAYSAIEIIVVLVFTVIQVKMLQGYVSHLGIV